MTGLQNGANREQDHDWLEPWWNLLKLANIITCHAVGMLFLVCVVRALEYCIGRLSPEPIVWTMSGVSVSLGQIVHYFDLATFVTFFIVALVDLVKWALRQ
jgi:hypothetical protein